MRRTKRLTALLLAMFLAFTTGYYDVSAASPDTAPAEVVTEGTESVLPKEQQEQDTQAVSDTESVTEDTESVSDTEDAAEDTETVPDTETAEDTEVSSEETETEAAETEETEAMSATETEETETVSETETEETENIPEALLNYLVVDQPVVTTPGVQKVMTGIGDGSREVESAVLTYQNIKTGQSYDVKASDILDDFVLFQMEYQDESWNGSYRLMSITYTIDGRTDTTSFREMGIDAAFGVNEVAESEPDDVLLTDEDLEALAAETDMNIVSLDGEGNAASEVDLETAMENAGCEVSDAASEITGKGAKGAGVDATGMKSLVVVLDPGHGGSDPGAQANGIVEKTVNLKIAQYCKEELEQYAGVTVYMTRNDDTYLTLAERAQVAIDKKADVFVSLHNNSNTSSTPNGANVYYPNSNYNATCGATGQALADVILSKLTDLGLASGGIHIRNSENGTKYPDGSLADYYGVIKRCKENGIPGLIVEHAFVSNANDAKNYLSTDAQLKKLGVADATGIAEYYGLSKGVGFNSIQSKSSTTMELTWTAQSGVTGYCIYRSTSSGSGFSQVATISSATTTTWKDTGLTPGTTYYYKIRTYTKSGSSTKYGSYSPVASGTTMVKPVITSIKSQSSKQLIISWDAVSNAASYEIYRATAQKGPFKKIATVNAINRMNYTDGTVKAGTLYYYRIRSVGQIDNTTTYSDYSEIVSGRTAKIPSGLAVQSRNSTTLRISWKADSKASGYVIRRATSRNGTYKKIATVSGGSKNYYDDKSVKENKTYYYKIQAYNKNNGVKGYSGYGSAANGKTVKKTSITRIVSTSSTKQTISWKKVDGANGYVIYRSTSKDGKYEKIKTITSRNTTSYKDTGLKAGTKYYYKVRTRNKVNGKTGYGTDSVIRSARAGKRAEITGVTGSTGTKITISWKKVTDAASYDIYRSTSEKGTYKKIGSASASDTSYTDSKLKMTKKYYYKVEARIKGYKATGTSGLSKIKSGYPVRRTSITSIAANENGQIEIKWNKIKDTKGYQIYRSTSASGTYSLIQTVSSYKTTSYVDTTATAGATYYYKIVLINKYDGKTIYGKDSSVVSFMLLSPPANVTVTSVSESQLDVSWSAVTGATGYVIYRSTELNGTYTEIGAIGSPAVTSYSDLTVTKDVTYYYKIKAIGANNNSSVFSSAASGCAVAKLAISSVLWGADNKSIQIAWKKTPAQITGYEVYKSSSYHVSSQTKVAETAFTACMDTDVNPSEVYYYRVRTYTDTIVNGKTRRVYGVFSDTVSTNPSDYRIMGSSGVTAAQMTAMYQASGKKYPASVYKGKGAADIQTFCQIVYEECAMEGIRPEVLFAQICHETAYLQFGGQVKAEQCNFGGLGATDDGVAGGTFADVRTGIRTQVQHMKAYASTDPLKQPCIDSRFAYINRGKAEYVQQLGNGNWATDPSYAVKIMNYIDKIKTK